MTFIDEHQDRCGGGLRWGVEPICRVLAEHGLQIAPATYYAAKTRPPSRSLPDEQLKTMIADVHAVNYSVYGVRKMHAALRCDGVVIGRDHTGRLMRKLGLAGVRRGQPKRTTRPDESAARPDQLWVCDLAYLRSWGGFAYLALVLDVFSRRIVGWAATHLRTDLPLEALEMALWTRHHQVQGLVHHTDAGSQYLSIRYTATLAAAGAVPSVGTVRDSFDNAMAESTIGQLKAELVHRRGPWRTVEQLEFALFEYIDWWNHRRLHTEIGIRTPTEAEAAHHAQPQPAQRAGSQ